MPELLEKIELKSEEVTEILTEVPNWMIRWGNLALLSLIVLLLTITWFIQYPDVLTAQVVITTEIPPQKTFAPMSGKLTELLVEDNAQVAPGQALAVMENTADYPSVVRLRAILDTVSLQQQQFVFPVDLLAPMQLGPIEAPYSLFVNSCLKYRLNRHYQPLQHQAEVNAQVVEELQLQLKALKAQQALGQRELALAQQELARHEVLFSEEVISTQEYERKQLQFAQQEKSLENTTAAVSRLRQTIKEAGQRLKSSKVNEVKEELLLWQEVTHHFHQLEKAIRDWEQQHVLRSDLHGTVSFLQVLTEQQALNQGDLVFSILPGTQNTFVARLRLPKANSGKIQPGQRVRIKLDQYPAKEFGTVEGTVKHMSLVTNTEGFYLVEVALPPALITSYQKPIDFRQEMTGTAEIVTEDLRLIERFFYPFRTLLDA
ncbi:MAG: HlyD family secretion protein [Salibacteraceae bacterium]